MEYEQILRYVFLWDVALWAEDDAVSDVDAVRSLLGELTRGLENDSFERRNLVTVGFLETLVPNTDLIPLLTPILRARLIEIGRL